jgi:L-lactate dehydrogenase complex protein LldG
VVPKTAEKGGKFMTILNRDAFLNKLAERLGRPRMREEIQKPEWDQARLVPPEDRKGCEEWVERLEKQAQLNRTTFFRIPADFLPEAVWKMIKKAGAKTVITWDDVRWNEYGLDPALNAKLEEHRIRLQQWCDEQAAESISLAEQAMIGITFSDLALAESATVMLLNGRGKGRSVSLLPHKYIAIIPRSTIVPRLTHATREIRRRIEKGELLPSCINFISGPSNSADIEMNLVVGVHGPVEVTYIIVDDR